MGGSLCCVHFVPDSYYGVKGWGFQQITGCDVPGFCKQLLWKREEDYTPKKIHLWKNSTLCWQNTRQLYKGEHRAHIPLLEFNRKTKGSSHLFFALFFLERIREKFRLTKNSNNILIPRELTIRKNPNTSEPHQVIICPFVLALF